MFDQYINRCFAVKNDGSLDLSDLYDVLQDYGVDVSNLDQDDESLVIRYGFYARAEIPQGDYLVLESLIESGKAEVVVYSCKESIFNKFYGKRNARTIGAGL